MLGGTVDVAGSLTFTSKDLAAIAQGGVNHGFGLVTIGSLTGSGNITAAGALAFTTNLTVQSATGNLILSSALGAAGFAFNITVGGSVSGNGPLAGAVSLHAGSLIQVIGGAGPLNVSNGSISLNNTPLSLTSVVNPLIAIGTVYTIVQTTAGVVPQFANLPDGTIVTVNGLDFTLHYTATAVTLTRSSTAAKVEEDRDRVRKE